MPLSRQPYQYRRRQNLETREHDPIINDIVDEKKPFVSFEEICYYLETNDPAFTELKIGWSDSDYLRGKKQIRALQYALRRNHTLTSVSVGWRYRDRELLMDFLRMLSQLNKNKYTKYKKQEHSLKSIKLTLNNWLPASLLLNLFSAHKSLEHVYIRATNVVIPPGGIQIKQAHNEDNDSWIYDHTILPYHYPRISSTNRNSWYRKKIQNMKKKNNDRSRVSKRGCSFVYILQECLGEHEDLKSLSLEDCDITHQTASLITNFVKQRGGMEKLSLRNNRRLAPPGLRTICEAPIHGTLDLSFCNIDDDGAIAIADAFRQRANRNGIISDTINSSNNDREKTISENRKGAGFESIGKSDRDNNGDGDGHETLPATLEELILCGNYEIGSCGSVALSNHCTNFVKHLDLSHCDVSDDQLQEMFMELLRKKKEDHISLEHITLHGSHLHSPETCSALSDLIRDNTTLQSISIKSPRKPHPLPINYLQELLTTIKDNYVFERLEIDNDYVPYSHVNDNGDTSTDHNHNINGPANARIHHRGHFPGLYDGDDNNNDDYVEDFDNNDGHDEHSDPHNGDGNNNFETSYDNNNGNNDIESTNNDDNTAEEVRGMQEELDFYLRLNRAGRKILRVNGPTNPDQNLKDYMEQDWINVLSGASGQLDILYWLLRNRPCYPLS